MGSRRDYTPVDASFSTKAIHIGYDPENWPSRSIIPPIHASVSSKMRFPYENNGLYYTRLANPSREVLQKCMAALDDAKHCRVFPSGTSAITAVCDLLEKDDHIVVADNIYGGCWRTIKKMQKYDIWISVVDSLNLENVKKEIKPNTKMVYVESPSNPFAAITDLPALSQLIKEIDPNILIVIDNTVQTPYFQKPLKHGADIVLYSLTKYMNGHSDVLMGSVVTNCDDVYEKLVNYQSGNGAAPSSFDCFLVHRSLKTLSLRMERHMKNALEVARFLEKHECVEKVFYPGLESHPQHSLAKKLFSGTSGLMSFYIKGGIEETKVFIESTKIFKLSGTLGDVQSLTEYGVSLFCWYYPREEYLKKGATENLIRLSVGIEDPNDLINDLDQALKKACNA